MGRLTLPFGFCLRGGLSLAFGFCLWGLAVPCLVCLWGGGLSFLVMGGLMLPFGLCLWWVNRLNKPHHAHDAGSWRAAGKRQDRPLPLGLKSGNALGLLLQAMALALAMERRSMRPTLHHFQGALLDPKLKFKCVPEANPHGREGFLRNFGGAQKKHHEKGRF